MEGSLVAYKVFTNGSVLNASEINDNLMNQSVMVFSNQAARTAAITAPLEGMLTWLEDVNRYESYNGTSWVSPFGLTFLTETPFTTAATVSVDNVFSSLYDNYVIQLSISANTLTADIRFVMRTAGSDFTTANYFGTGISTTTSTTAITTLNITASTFGFIATTGGNMSSEIKLYSPNLPRVTHLTEHSLSLVGNSVNTMNGNYVNGTNQFDGIKFYPSAGTFTGSLRIYGMRKS